MTSRARTHLGVARVGPAAAAIALAALGDGRALAALVPLVVVCHLVPRRAIARAAELGIYALLAALVVVLARYGGEPRGGAPTTVALVCAAFVFVRAVLAPSFAARGADLALLVVAAVAIGAPPQRFLPFAPIATALVAFAAASDTRLATHPLEALRRPRELLGPLVFLVLAVAIGIGTGKAMPRITYRYATRFAKMLWNRPRSGFDEDMFLADGDGSSPKILESDTVVLRVSGANVDHLRGRVYDFFDGRRWHGITSLGDLGAPVRREGERGAVAIEAAHPTPVYFAPLDRAVLGSSPRDGGVFRGPVKTTWELYPVLPIAPPPTTRDLRYDRAFPEEIRALAEEWTAGKTGENERLAAIEEHLLRDYRYTLERPAFAGSALHDFLFVHKAGHCELFATAFALLARASGIPARVIGGYRVIEPGPRGDTYVVRERHAHAWVEAFHGKAWHTWDPTPAIAFARKAPWWEVALDTISDPRAVASFGAVALVVAGVVVVRTVVARRRAARAATARPIHPALARLEEGLGAEGVVRDPAEGLLAFAKRLDEDGDHTAAEAVRACAYLVYGDEGTEEDLAALVARRLGAPPRRPSPRG